MNTRSLALAMVGIGLLCGMGGAYFRAFWCGTQKHCDEHWNAAALTASGAVGMGWAWLTQAPAASPRKPSGKPSSSKDD